MKLFYCHSKAGNYDLFVHADTPSEAGKLWGQHFASDQERPRRVWTYDLSQLALCPSVMDWERIPCTLAGAT